MPINDGKYVVPAWQDGGPPAIDAAELTDIGQSIVTNQNGVTQNTQNVSALQQQMSTANQNIASLQQFQTTATGQIANLTNNYLPKSGGTMTGPITLPGNPSGALQAVPKQYVDAKIVAGSYTGDNAVTRLISLGKTPIAVFVYPTNGISVSRSSSGLAVTNAPAYGDNDYMTVQIVQNGFNVFRDSSNGNAYTNRSTVNYNYVAWF